jgi:hypothetical protein
LPAASSALRLGVAAFCAATFPNVPVYLGMFGNVPPQPNANRSGNQTVSRFPSDLARWRVAWRAGSDRQALRSL